MRGTIRYAIVLALMAAAFLAGYLPERNRSAQLLRELRDADRALRESNARLRLARIEGLAVKLLHVANTRNAAEVRSEAERFFVELRVEMVRPDMAAYRKDLEGIAQSESEFLATLAKPDANPAASCYEWARRLQLLIQPSYPISLPPVLSRPLEKAEGQP